MVQLIICQGLPSSGKTTYAKAWVAEDPSNRTRISRDDIRMNFLNMNSASGVLDSKGENTVTKVQRELVETFLLRKFDVIIDDTNLKLSVAKSWADLATVLKADFSVIDFTDVPVQECIRRDIERGSGGERMVGKKVIEGMYNRYLARGPLGTVEARTDLPSRLYVPDENLPKAYIFDVDGTVAKMGNRSPYDWDKVHLDTLIQPVYNLYSALRANHEIIIMSGRDSGCRAQTEEWLDKHDITYSALFMRAAGDNRKDSIIKSELFFNQVAPKWFVLGAVDDRSQVVEGTWRAMGLLCMQVAPGDF